jgi:hypothetical protein
MVLRYPDEPLPEIQVSLQEYVHMALAILDGPDHIDDFCRMVLAGRVNIDGEEHRLFINARQGLENINPARYRCTRDYDSMLSCTSNLPFNAPLSIFPVASFKDTLTADIHLIGKALNKAVS